MPVGHGTHAGVYGSVLPFDLAGGSPGGAMTIGWNGGLGNCVPVTMPGGGGGGTLVLEANGTLDVYGKVSANGGEHPWSSVGSGGSILLRGLGGLTIHPQALVQATALAPLLQVYPPGIIRLDAYGRPPQVLGTVDPQPTVCELPLIEEVTPALLGSY